MLSTDRVGNLNFPFDFICDVGLKQGRKCKNNDEEIHNRQFGSLKGSSTTFCLLDLILKWIFELENSDHYRRACFLDFSKAFDRINNNIVITKLVDLEVHRSIIL